MKLNPFRLVLLLLIIVSLSSCNWFETDATVASSNPSFVSLTFAENDSVVGLEDAVFTLEWDALLNDSVIVNLDSLPYLTDITEVIPTFSFYSTSGAYVYMTDTLGLGTISDSIALTGTDTLNFERVAKIKNFAADGKEYKVYPIKVNVHQVEPELYQWNKIADEIYSHSGSLQKAVYFNKTFYLYVGTSIRNYLYTSTDGKMWIDKTNALKNMPLNSSLRGINEFNGKLYVLSDDDKIYTTADGYEWTGENGDISDTNYKFENFLFELDGKLWSIMKSGVDNTYRFANSADGKTWIVYGQIPVNFPIGDFSSLSFASRTKKTKALIAGGYTASGKLLNNIWSTENGSIWVDFSTENTTLGSLSGATIIPYDDKLLLYGGVDDNGNIVDSSYMESIDEGLSWSVPDTLYNRLRQMNISAAGDTTYTNYAPRAYQSVLNVVIDHTAKGYSDHLIYLIGGINPRASKVYKDVWVGKLNRLSFPTDED